MISSFKDVSHGHMALKLRRHRLLSQVRLGQADMTEFPRVMILWSTRITIALGHCVDTVQRYIVLVG